MLAPSAVTVPYGKIQYAGPGGTPSSGSVGLVDPAGVTTFGPGDLVAFLSGTGKWELADGDHDVAATTQLAVALNNPYTDAFTVPPRDRTGAAAGARFGPDDAEFDFDYLQDLQWIISVNSGTDYTALLAGAWYGLLWVVDAAAPGGGYMTVDLSDTTNTDFFVEGLAGTEFGRPNLGIDADQYNIVGNKQVRVVGRFASARRYGG